jgi:hypothetical protein
MSWRNGCCVDGVCKESTCMTLPSGKTCGDCQHVAHCVAMYRIKPDNTSCDFYPRRFLPVLAAT